MGPRRIRKGSGEISLPNIVRVIKCRRLSWAGHVARMGGSRSAYKILTGTPTVRRSRRRS